MAYRQAGRFAEAQQVYREILQAQPRHADALHLLGLAEHQQGRHQDAVEWTGKALVEQILSSHPAVYGAGELKEIALATKTLPNESKMDVPYPQCVEDLDAVTVEELAGTYVARLMEIGGGAARVVDKMMTNFLHLGFIALLLPQAKIIHCRRHPLDVDEW